MPVERPADDRYERAARIGCGTLLGLVTGGIVAIGVLPASWLVLVGIVTLALIACIALALRYGERFFESYQRWLRRFR